MEYYKTMAVDWYDHHKSLLCVTDCDDRVSKCHQLTENIDGIKKRIEELHFESERKNSLSNQLPKIDTNNKSFKKPQNKKRQSITSKNKAKSQIKFKTEVLKESEKKDTEKKTLVSSMKVATRKNIRRPSWLGKMSK